MKALVVIVAMSLTLVVMGQLQPASETNLVTNGNFDEPIGNTWTGYGAPYGISDGALCMQLDDPLENRFDAALRQVGVTIRNGDVFRLTFDGSATGAGRVHVRLAEADEPYREAMQQDIEFSSVKTTYVVDGQFDLNEETLTVLLDFQVGEASGRVCIDNVVLISQSQ